MKTEMIFSTAEMFRTSRNFMIIVTVRFINVDRQI